MPSMSYCVCENTSSDMSQILSRMFEHGAEYVAGMNSYERDAYHILYEKCREFITRYEEIQKEEVEE